MEARKLNGTADNPTKSREDLFIKTRRPLGTPGALDDVDASRRGSVWKINPANLVQLEPGQVVENEPKPPSAEDELERMKRENEELKQKLQSLQTQQV